MIILYNGKIGARQYRLLVVMVNGELWVYRPYVGAWKYGFNFEELD